MIEHYCAHCGAGPLTVSVYHDGDVLCCVCYGKIDEPKEAFAEFRARPWYVRWFYWAVSSW